MVLGQSPTNLGATRSFKMILNNPHSSRLHGLHFMVGFIESSSLSLISKLLRDRRQVVAILVLLGKEADAPGVRALVSNGHLESWMPRPLVPSRLALFPGTLSLVSLAGTALVCWTVSGAWWTAMGRLTWTKPTVRLRKNALGALWEPRVPTLMTWEP